MFLCILLLAAVRPGAVVGRVAGPQGEVVPEQLHDEGGVLVALLVQGVQLGDRIVKCLKNVTLYG